MRVAFCNKVSWKDKSTKNSPKCEYCPIVTSNKIKLKEHIEKEHKEYYRKYLSENKPYACEECGFCTSHLKRLQDHQLLHMVCEVPILCTDCGQTNETQYEHKKHVLIHLKPEMKKKGSVIS